MILRDNMDTATRHAMDGLSMFTVVATIANWLPAIAALLTIIWTALRIYETKTVQRALGRDVSKRDEKEDS